MSQQGRIKMKRMDSDLQQLNRNKSRSLVMESLSSLLFILSSHSVTTLLAQTTPVSPTQANPAQYFCPRTHEADGFLAGPQQQEGTWSCHPLVTQGLAWIASPKKAVLTSPNSATLTLCSSFAASEEEYPEQGVSRYKWPHAHSNWLEFCRPGFNPQLQHGLTG